MGKRSLGLISEGLGLSPSSAINYVTVPEPPCSGILFLWH